MVKGRRKNLKSFVLILFVEVSFCFYMGRSLQKNDTNASEEHIIINIVEFSCSLSCSQNSLTSDKSLKNLKPIFFLGVA